MKKVLSATAILVLSTSLAAAADVATKAAPAIKYLLILIVP